MPSLMVGVSLMFSLLLGSMSLQTVPPQPPEPVTPNHRYLIDHRPRHEVRSSEWLCKGSTRPSGVSLEIRTIGSSNHVVLKSLRVSGRRPSDATVLKLQVLLKPFSALGAVYGSCLDRPSGKSMPLVNIQGYINGNAEVQRVKLDLIEK